MEGRYGKWEGGGGRFKTSKDQPSDRKDVNQFAYLVRLGLQANWPSLSHVRRVRNFFSPHFSNQLRKWEYAVDISLKSCELQQKLQWRMQFRSNISLKSCGAWKLRTTESNCNCSCGATFIFKVTDMQWRKYFLQVALFHCGRKKSCAWTYKYFRKNTKK
jgi:hypothetical protein